MDKSTIPKATLGRLPDYLEYLKSLPLNRNTDISATTIAKAMGLGDVQVRKDLNIVSGKGRPKLGYNTEQLIKSLESVLGNDKTTYAVLVGAGRLGRALIEFDEFKKFGVEISAAFDLNKQTINIGSRKAILPMNQFEDYCRNNKIHIGVITVGSGSAQTVCDKMTECGITAIWNFAPCKLTVPEGVILKQENLALSLAYLNNQLCN